MSPHIVVVEDEPALREMLRDALQQEGFLVTPLPQGDLDQRSWPHHVDVFLIDLMLPEYDGIEVARWLATHGFRDTPMIGMSASSSELREAGAHPLFDEILPKPFDLVELVSRIRRHLAPSIEERQA